MKSRILCLLAVVALVAMTVPAFAAVENVKVGGGINFKFIERTNFDLIDNNAAGVNDGQHYIYTGTTVFVTADLSENIMTKVQLINERDWGNDYLRELSGTLILDQAYVKISDFLTKNLVLTVGRQEIKFGDGLVVGSRYRALDYVGADLGTAALDYGMQKAFDAVKVDYAIENTPVSISAFRAKILESYGNLGTLPLSIPVVNDLDLYGITVPVKCEKFYIEPYFVDAVMPHVALNLMTAGLRAGVMPLEGLEFKGEFAKQFGDADLGLGTGADFKGWAGTLGAGYTFQVPMKPMIAASYERCSEAKATDVDMKAWIPVFPSDVASRVGKIAYPALFAAGDGPAISAAAAGSGLQVIKLAFGIQPMEKLGIGLDLFNLRAIETAVGVDKEYGTEADLSVNWKYTDDVAFGLDLGYLWTGDNVKDNLGGAGEANAWQVIASMNVAF